MVRDAGDPAGPVVVFFHGSPGSRIDAVTGEDGARAAGVRVVSFDRPGYGRSDPAPFSLSSVARDVEVIAGALGLGRIAALGVSGGGPFALAAAAVLGERVTRAGLVSAPGPLQQVPGALDNWSEEDIQMLALLPGQPDRVIGKALAEMQPLVAMRDDEQALRGWIDAILGGVDVQALPPGIHDHLAASVREGLRQGGIGLAWDNVAWTGPWDIDLAQVHCPVHLWYGDSDPLAPPFHGQWLKHHLPNPAEFTVVNGVGHIAVLRHWQQMLQVLTGQSTATFVT